MNFFIKSLINKDFFLSIFLDKSYFVWYSSYIILIRMGVGGPKPRAEAP